MSLLKIAGRNRIISPLRIEAKPFENLFLWDSKMTNFTPTIFIVLIFVLFCSKQHKNMMIVIQLLRP